MGTDPRLANVQDRRRRTKPRSSPRSRLSTSQRTKQELLKHLGGQVPFAPGQRRARRLRHPHFAARTWWCRCRIPASTMTPKVAGVASR